MQSILYTTLNADEMNVIFARMFIVYRQLKDAKGKYSSLKRSTQSEKKRSTSGVYDGELGVDDSGQLKVARTTSHVSVYD